MKVKGRNLSMTRGDSESLTITCTDADPASLTYNQIIPFVIGDTVYFTIKSSIMETEKILQKVITEFTPEGRAIAVIEPTDTKEIMYNTYVYDIQVIRDDGTVTTIVPVSNFTIEGEVTYE